jgi:hypothetical protein
LPLFEFAKNDAGYEKTGDHEKNVDAYEPAGNLVKAAMEEDDEQNGNSPQTVNVAPILQPLPPTYRKSTQTSLDETNCAINLLAKLRAHLSKTVPHLQPGP